MVNEHNTLRCNEKKKLHKRIIKSKTERLCARGKLIFTEHEQHYYSFLKVSILLNEI